MGGRLRVTATILFMVSGIVAVLVAPNQVAALDQFALLCLGVAAAWVLAWLARAATAAPVLGTVGLLCAWLAAVLGGLYLLTHDWSATVGDFAFRQQVGLALRAALPAMVLPAPFSDTINDNVLASGLVVMLPLGAGGLAWVLRCGRNRLLRWLVGGLTWLALALAGAVLLLTFSLGGWLGLAVGVVCGGWLTIRPRFRRSLLKYMGDAVAVALPLVLVGLFFMALVAPESSGPIGSSSVVGSGGSRASLWQDALTLIGDYRFTGGGYGSTMMVLSTYVYLLYVGFIPHVHNLYLEIAVEQGMVGLFGFLFLAGTAGWDLYQAFSRRTLPRALAGAATAALVAMLLHGLVDAGLYVSKLAPLLFLPMGFAWGMAPRVRRTEAFSWERCAQRTAVALAPLLLVIVLFAWPGSRGAFQANLGAVSQTRAELARYSWPGWPIQDALRRNPGVDLDPAIARYAAALGYDGGNATANRRLGQIAIGRGDYGAAQRFLEAAHMRAPDQSATRLLLGEVYAVTGRVDDAATLWRTVDTSYGQLDGREWWLGEVGTPEQIESFREARKRLVPG